MKNTFLMLLLFVATITFAQKADDIVGKYHLPNALDVEIYKVGDTYNGKIIALNNYEDGVIRDIKNSDKSKRNDLLLGKEILTNLEFDNEGKQWVNGDMYGPGKGIMVNLKVTEIKTDEITVVGSKYFFWRTLQWKKLK